MGGPWPRLGFTLVLIMGLSGTGRGQAPARNPRLDSLEARLPQVPRPDTNRVNTLNELIWENRDSHPRRSLALAVEALALGERLQFRRGIAKTYILRGIIYATTGRFDDAIADFEQCRRQRAALGDWQGVAGAINNVGEVEVEQGRYAAAVAHYVEALRLEQRYGTPERIAADLANIGTVYFRMGQYDQALAYQQQYLRLPGRVVDAHNDALAYQLIGQTYEQLAQPDSALHYFERALAASRGRANWRGEGQAELGRGRVLAARQQYAAATAGLARALVLARKADDLPTCAAIFSAQGQLALRQQKPAEARPQFAAAYALSRQLKAREATREALAGLAATARQQADYRAAANYGEQLAALKDSLLTEASTRQIAEMNVRYETEQKTAENRLQAAQLLTQQQVIRRRNVQLGAGLALALLGAGLAYLLYARHRLRQRLEHEQERQLLYQQRTAAVFEAEENERRRIGSDLHDGVGQLITAAKLNLNALARDLDTAPPAALHLLVDNALSVLNESYREVRDISHNLMPNALLKQGLGAAVRDFLSKMVSADGLRAEVQLFGLDERLPALVESVLFRVIQELAQNIVKHARATVITLQLVRSADELTIMVEDNGQGFDPAALQPGAGLGLSNIETRLAYLGGQLFIDAAIGRGTIVTLTVPLPVENAA